MQKIVHSVDEALAFVKEFNYPIMLEPAFTLNGAGYGVAHNEEQLKDLLEKGLKLSPVGEVLAERAEPLDLL